MNTTAAGEDVKKSIPRWRSLYEIARILNSSLDLKEVYPRILSVLSQQMGMKRGGVVTMRTESNDWAIDGVHGLSAEEMRKRKEYFGSGVIQRVRERGQMAAVIEDGESIWLFEGKTKTSLKRSNVSFLCAPMKIQGSVAAIVGVDHFFGEPVEVSEDFEFLGEVCSLIGDALRLRKDIAAEKRALLEENWSFRKELENLGRSVPKTSKRISLTEILEDRLARMITELKLDPRSNGHLYNDVLNVVERTLLTSALEKTKHVQLKTARFLGINRNTLRRKIKDLGITGKKK